MPAGSPVVPPAADEKRGDTVARFVNEGPKSVSLFWDDPPDEADGVHVKQRRPTSTADTAAVGCGSGFLSPGVWQLWGGGSTRVAIAVSYSSNTTRENASIAMP